MSTLPGGNTDPTAALFRALGLDGMEPDAVAMMAAAGAAMALGDACAALMGAIPLLAKAHPEAARESTPEGAYVWGIAVAAHQVALNAGTYGLRALAIAESRRAK